jgi:hypothetical protein
MKRRLPVVKSSTMIKKTPGVYVGVVSSGRKVYTYAESQEDASFKLRNGIKPNENLKFVYITNDLVEE